MAQHIISKVADDAKGKINIYPTIDYGKYPFIRIVGDPEGLRYLANLLNTLADYDQDSNNDPIGTREHTVLSPEAHLGFHSCKVELCRADAKGTGELADIMEE